MNGGPIPPTERSGSGVTDRRYSTSSDLIDLIPSGEETGTPGGARIAMLTSWPPQRSGVAAYAEALRRALLETSDAMTIDVIAVAERAGEIAWSPEVVSRIEKNFWGSYRDAADFIDAAGYDVVSLQHESGLFGGSDGAYVIDMVRRLRTPVATTFHTLRAHPTPACRTRVHELVLCSRAVVTLSPSGRRLIQREYGGESEQIRVIPHGITDIPFVMPEERKEAWGFQGRRVLLTSGLIGPKKGIDVMIEALPAIVERHPDVLYVVAGVDHPSLSSAEAKDYRQKLAFRIERLGLERHVRFIDRYLEDHELHSLLQACDVYVTPFRNRDQISSGALSRALGAGRALVSNPNLYAIDLLSGRRGRLVDFDSVRAFSGEINRLLENEGERRRLYRRAYEYSRSMTWGVVAETYHDLFAALRRERSPASERVA